MKGLDTPILLGVVHGSPWARNLLRSLAGGELATSEINLYELELLAAHGPREVRTSRQKALVGLRRRVTVVPVTADSVSQVGRRRFPLGYEPLIWATMSAAGCSEWITSKNCAPPKGATGMRVRIVG